MKRVLLTSLLLITFAVSFSSCYVYGPGPGYGRGGYHHGGGHHHGHRGGYHGRW